MTKQPKVKVQKPISEYKPSKKPRVVPLVLTENDFATPDVVATWPKRVVLEEIGTFDTFVTTGVLLETIA